METVLWVLQFNKPYFSHLLSYSLTETNFQPTPWLNQLHILRFDTCISLFPFTKCKTHLTASDFSLPWTVRERIDSWDGQVQGYDGYRNGWIQGCKKMAKDWAVACNRPLCTLHICTQSTPTQNHVLWHELHPPREKGLSSFAQRWVSLAEIWNWLPNTERARRGERKRCIAPDWF